MKNSFQTKFLAIVASLAMAMMIGNCDIINPKKSDDNTPLLLAALLLSQQPPDWAVSMTARLKNGDGSDLSAVTAVTLTDNAPSTSVLSGSSRSLVFDNNDTSVKVFANPAAQAGVGVFNISFLTNNPTTLLKFGYTTLRGGGNADLISDYTVAAGESIFTYIVNDAEPENKDQVSGLNSSGRVLEIISVRTVRRGSYNLPNPTVGERLCDGATAGSPVVKQGTISSGEIWSGTILLRGTVFADAPITVQPGTVIFGERGSSFFIRGANKLTAIGTAANPICWTSASRPGARQPGDWGGIVTIGDSGTTRATAGNTEGPIQQPYGGGTANPGTLNLEMEYNIIEFAGNEVAPGDELNSLSLYASNTKLTNVQAHRGLDDQFEQWGGVIDWNRLVATGGLDDDYDLDEGVKGTINNAIGHKYPAVCGGTASTDPHGLEWDGINSGATNGFGASTVTINRFVLIGAGITSGQAARLREGVVATLNNGAIWGFVEGVNRRGGNGVSSTVTTSNVRMQASVDNFNNTGTDDAKGTADTAGSPHFGIARNLAEFPIVSDAGINTENNCGFSANKPDYSLTSAASSAQGPSEGAGKFWEGWTVYRAR